MRGLANSGLAVADATTNTIQIDGNTGSGGTFGVPTLSGDGTLTLTSTLADKWFALNGTAEFTGTLDLRGMDGQTVNTVRLTTAVGGKTFPGTVVNLNDVSLSNRQGVAAGVVAVFEFGELHGDEQSVLNAFVGGSAAVDANWVIGGLNTNSDFAGTIINGARQQYDGVVVARDQGGHRHADALGREYLHGEYGRVRRHAEHHQCVLADTSRRFVICRRHPQLEFHGGRYDRFAVPGTATQARGSGARQHSGAPNISPLSAGWAG